MHQQMRRFPAPARRLSQAFSRSDIRCAARKPITTLAVVVGPRQRCNSLPAPCRGNVHRRWSSDTAALPINAVIDVDKSGNASSQFLLASLLQEASRAAHTLNRLERQAVATSAIMDVAVYLRGLPVEPWTGKRLVPANVVRSLLQLLCELGEFGAALRAFKEGFLGIDGVAGGANSEAAAQAELGITDALGGSGGLTSANLSDPSVRAHLEEQPAFSLAARLFLGCQIAGHAKDAAGAATSVSDVCRDTARVAATLRVAAALTGSLTTLRPDAPPAPEPAPAPAAAGAGGADAGADGADVHVADTPATPAGNRAGQVSPAAARVSEATALFKRCTRYAEATLGVQVLPESALTAAAGAGATAAASSSGKQSGSARASSKERAAAVAAKAAADSAAAAAIIAPAREQLVHALLRTYSRLGLPSAAAAAGLGYRPNARLVLPSNVGAAAAGAGAGTAVGSGAGAGVSVSAAASGSLYLSVFPPPARRRRSGSLGAVGVTGSGHLTEAVTLTRARLGDLAAAMAAEQAHLAAAREVAGARARRLERTARLKARLADEAAAGAAAASASAGSADGAGAASDDAGSSEAGVSTAVSYAKAGQQRSRSTPPGASTDAQPGVIRDSAAAAMAAAARAAVAARAAARDAARAARAAGREADELHMAMAMPAHPPVHPGAFLWMRRGGLWTPRRNNALLRLLEAGVWRPLRPGHAGAVGLPRSSSADARAHAHAHAARSSSSASSAGPASDGGAAVDVTEAVDAGADSDAEAVEAAMREAASEARAQSLAQSLPSWMRPRLRRPAGHLNTHSRGQSFSRSGSASGSGSARGRLAASGSGAGSLRERTASASARPRSSSGVSFYASREAFSGAAAAATSVPSAVDGSSSSPSRSSTAAAAAGTTVAPRSSSAGASLKRSASPSTSSSPSASPSAGAGAGIAGAGIAGSAPARSFSTSATAAAAVAGAGSPPAAAAASARRTAPSKSAAAPAPAPAPASASAPVPSGYEDLDFAALDEELASSVAATGDPMALASALGLGANVAAHAAEIAASPAPSASGLPKHRASQPSVPQPRSLPVLGDEEYDAFRLSPFRAPLPQGYTLTDAAVEPTRAAYRMARAASLLGHKQGASASTSAPAAAAADCTLGSGAGSGSGTSFTIFPAGYHPAVDTVLIAAPVSATGRAGGGDGVRPISDCHSAALPLLASLWREASGRVIARDGIGFLAVPGGLQPTSAAAPASSASSTGGAAAAAGPSALAWTSLTGTLTGTTRAATPAASAASASCSGASERLRLLLSLAANRQDVTALLRMASADGVALRGACLLTAATQLARFGDVAAAHAVLQTSSAQLNTAITRRCARLAKTQLRREAAAAAAAGSPAAPAAAAQEASSTAAVASSAAPDASALASEQVTHLGRLTDPLPLAVEIAPPTLASSPGAGAGQLLAMTADEIAWVASIRDGYDALARAFAADGAHVLALTAARARAACFRRLHDVTAPPPATATPTPIGGGASSPTAAAAPAASAPPSAFASKQAAALRHAMGWHPSTLRSLLRSAVRLRLTLDVRSLLHFLRAAAWTDKPGIVGCAVTSPKGGGGAPVDCGPAGPLWNPVARKLWHLGPHASPASPATAPSAAVVPTPAAASDAAGSKAKAAAAKAATPSAASASTERLRLIDFPSTPSSATSSSASPTPAAQQLRQMANDLALLQRAVDALPLPQHVSSSSSAARSRPGSGFIFPTTRLIAEVDAASRLPPSSTPGSAPSPAVAVHRAVVSRVLPMFAAASAHAAPLLRVLPENAASTAGLKPADIATAGAGSSQPQAQAQPMRMPASLARTIIAAYARAGAPSAAAAAARLCLSLGARLNRAGDFLPIIEAASCRDDVTDGAFPALRLIVDCGALLPRPVRASVTREQAGGGAEVALDHHAAPAPAASGASNFDDDIEAQKHSSAATAAIVSALLRLSARVAEADNTPVLLPSLRRAAASAAPAASAAAAADATQMVTAAAPAAEPLAPSDVVAPKPLPRNRGREGSSVPSASTASAAASDSGASGAEHAAASIVPVPVPVPAASSPSRLTPAQAARVASVIARHSVFADTRLGRRVRDALRGRLGLEAEGQAQGAEAQRLALPAGAASAAATTVAPASGAGERPLLTPSSPVQALLQAQAAARELVTAVINVTVQQMEAQARARADIMASASVSAVASAAAAGGAAQPAAAAPASAVNVDFDGEEEEVEDWLIAAQEMLLLAVREWPVARGSDGVLLPLLKDDVPSASASSATTAAASSAGGSSSWSSRGSGGRGRRGGRMPGRPGTAVVPDAGVVAALPPAPPAMQRVAAALESAAAGHSLPFARHMELVEQAAGTSIGHLLALARAPRSAPDAATVATALWEHGGALQMVWASSPFGPHKYRYGLSVDEDGTGTLGRWPVFRAPRTVSIRPYNRMSTAETVAKRVTGEALLRDAEAAEAVDLQAADATAAAAAAASASGSNSSGSSSAVKLTARDAARRLRRLRRLRAVLPLRRGITLRRDPLEDMHEELMRGAGAGVLTPQQMLKASRSKGAGAGAGAGDADTSDSDDDADVAAAAAGAASTSPGAAAGVAHAASVEPVTLASHGAAHGGADVLVAGMLSALGRPTVPVTPTVTMRRAAGDGASSGASAVAVPAAHPGASSSSSSSPRWDDVARLLAKAEAGLAAERKAAPPLR